MVMDGIYLVYVYLEVSRVLLGVIGVGLSMILVLRELMF